jgi:chaperonin cofactor prefoldin
MTSRKLKRSRIAPRDPLPEGMKASTVAPIAFSGYYIGLANEGLLDEFSRLRTELRKLHTELANTEDALRNCNDPVWLDAFSVQVRRQSRKFEPALTDRAAQLERQRYRIKARIEKIQKSIQEIEPSIPDMPVTSLTIPAVRVKFSPASVVSGSGRNVSASVATRDFAIQKYRDLPDKEICAKLDAELLTRGGPPTGFPEHWREKYSCETFLSAYENPESRNLVQKMISKAKAKS